jgi:hypothetical protein
MPVAKGVQTKYLHFLIEGFFHFPPVSATPTPLVHLELRISLRICEQIRNGGAQGLGKN